MTPRQLKVLRKLAPRVLSTCELTDEEIPIVQDLVKRKLARDYADFYRRRTPLHLRLWGITPAGQAILTQYDQAIISTRRSQLPLGPIAVELTKPLKKGSNIRVRIRSPQPPEGLKLIPSYRNKK